MATLTNKKALKIGIRAGVERDITSKASFSANSKFLELFHFSNIILLSLLTLFNLR